LPSQSSKVIFSVPTNSQPTSSFVLAANQLAMYSPLEPSSQDEFFFSASFEIFGFFESLIFIKSPSSQTPAISPLLTLPSREVK